ncbi:cysteine--tRNA ligase [Spirochaeta africana]|uniref:Cysteine--tRNA ligase n=1 Tax=Spirochaeta africana (strain ATCC 700263 / DSM 8902 / Z-7692) TaxID=889378 RepID=H9UJU5_SPIAZ|nr:cysteine--tRNA ligase [Spirochaeta africana]AFG37788.1 cysteinyl-tRNA synthetase [Spirochaeta africana DSM 8902]
MSLPNDLPIHIYNSKTRSREHFTPFYKDHIGMYVCGPTVYGDTHLGNARPPIIFDVVFRFFSLCGYRVRYVRNITDVGHLEDEQRDQGEDKLARTARLAKLEPMEVAQTYTNQYRTLLGRMGVLPPSIEPTASGHIIEQQEIIQRIMDAGYAYESKGSIYFDLKKFAADHPYGGLSGKNMEELLSGTRGTAGLDDKRSPLDFALWKSADPAHIMRWQSPWGVGFPGWHLECTAMSTKYLGETFDIHGGGLDLQFPHHEAEIAQNRAAYGSDPARFWMHNNMITIDGQKMSKSLGNFVTLHQLFNGSHPLFSKPYSPLTVRFFLLQAHYRSPIDLSDPALAAAEKGLQRLREGYSRLAALAGEPAIAGLEYGCDHGFLALDPSGRLRFSLDDQMHRPVWDLLGQDGGEAGTDSVAELCARCWQHLADDFNTAKAIADLFEMTHYAGRIEAGTADKPSEAELKLLYQTFTLFYLGVLGLGSESSGPDNRLEQVVQMLIEYRADARARKDYAASDRIRDALQELGISLLDGKDGTGFKIQ